LKRIASYNTYKSAKSEVIIPTGTTINCGWLGVDILLLLAAPAASFIWLNIINKIDDYDRILYCRLVNVNK